MNEPLIVLKFWLKNIEEDFHIYNPENNLSEIYTTQNLTNTMNNMVNTVNYMEKVIIGLQ